MGVVIKGAEERSFRKQNHKNNSKENLRVSDKFNGECYFILYETESIVNSFIVFDTKNAASAWDESVSHIENLHQHETPVIKEFKKV